LCDNGAWFVGEEVPILGEEEEGEGDRPKEACKEDEDFMSAFDRLVAEQMQDRKDRPSGPGNVDIGNYSLRGLVVQAATTSLVRFPSPQNFS